MMKKGCVVVEKILGQKKESRVWKSTLGDMGYTLKRRKSM